MEAQNMYAAVSFSSQGQRSRSHMPSFIHLIEPTKTRYHVKLHPYLTSSLQVIDNSRNEKYENI